MPKKEYHRLTRARSRSGFNIVSASRSSLWRGGDHLLCIDSSGYTESYKRFYYRDIQAITIVATKRRVVWNWILAIPTILCLALLFSALSFRNYWEDGIVIVYTVSALLFGVPLLINLVRGPTCTCYLRTAVQTEELPSLSRVRRARKALDRLRPLIAAAQGNPPAPEELSARMQELVETVAGNPAVNIPASPAANNPAAPPGPA